MFCEVYGSEFVSFSSDSKFHRFEVDVTPIQVGEFRDAESSRIDTFRYSVITNSLDIILIDSFKISHNFFIREKGYFTIGGSHEIKCCWVDGGNSLFLEVFEPASECNDMGIDGFDRESRVCEIKSPCVDVIFFYGFNLEREEGLYFSDYGPSLAIFYATLWEENVMIHSFWEIFCSSWFNPLDKTPDMKGVLFQCFE